MTEAELREAEEALKAEAFGEAAHLAIITRAGSTISETKRMSIPLLAKPELLGEMAPAWTENRRMIEQWISLVLEQSRTCPGRDDPRCCQTTPDRTCFPKWVEREDPEWYAPKIHLWLSLVNNRIQQQGNMVPALAADEAFELGCLFTEALIKFRWEKDTNRGLAVVEGAQKGGRSNSKPSRLSTEETVDEIDRHLADGKQKKVAYSLVAAQQGVSEQTIRKEYRRAKKSGRARPIPFLRR